MWEVLAELGKARQVSSYDYCSSRSFDILDHCRRKGLLPLSWDTGTTAQSLWDVGNSLPSELGSAGTGHLETLKFGAMLVLQETCDQFCPADKEHLGMQKEH